MAAVLLISWLCMDVVVFTYQFLAWHGRNAKLIAWLACCKINSWLSMAAEQINSRLAMAATSMAAVHVYSWLGVPSLFLASWLGIHSQLGTIRFRGKFSYKTSGWSRRSRKFLNQKRGYHEIAPWRHGPMLCCAGCSPGVHLLRKILEENRLFTVGRIFCIFIDLPSWSPGSILYFVW